HPHFKSVAEEGLWGFPRDRLGINERRWRILRPGMKILLYFEHKGVRGVWVLAEIVKTFRGEDRVSYWHADARLYPFRVIFKPIFPRVKKRGLDVDMLDKVKPITREELSHYIPVFRTPGDRWSLFIFGETKTRGVTYPYEKFRRIWIEFETRNSSLPTVDRLTHDNLVDIIFKIGEMQGRFPEKEYPLEESRVDVVWRRIARGNPYIVFEVNLKGGDLYRDLVKLKHAFDLWNAIPVLVTTKDKIKQAQQWIQGSFHEIEEFFRVVSVEEIVTLYEKKKEFKEFERKLRLF
ncbi:MAG: hypothetical protein J7L38_04230, partial [Thermoproteales archaeon]|nr:hypothetical protein [Thermoproteales archaeon]